MKKKRKIGRKLLGILLTLAMIVGLMPGMGLTAYAQEWSGEGTESSPYLISSLDDLKSLRDSVNAGTDYSGKYFKLTANIDCGNDNWNPIGYLEMGRDIIRRDFKGTFDGNGKTVTYHVANDSDDYIGLFALIGNGATVKNLSVAGSISGSGQYYGGIAGDNSGTIQNCSSSVSITGSGDFYGGITGINKGTINHCVASGTLNWTGASNHYAYTAGIAGQSTGTVNNCVSLCDISAVNANEYSYAGRVIGRKFGTVADCYYLSTATITGSAVNADNATEKTADELKAIGETAYNDGYTVYALALGYPPHTHSFTYEASGSTITATCNGDGTCDINDVLTLTISAPTELTYDGSSKAATLSDDYNTMAFPDDYTIKYYQGAEEVQAANVKDAGDYTAKVTVGEATASVDFTIVKATPSISTIPTASAITYGQKLADSTLTGGVAKLGDTTVAGMFAWKNTETKPAVSDSNATEYDVVFTPTDADNYAAVECKVKLTINKADPTVTAPTAKTLTYNGKAQELINAGSTGDGKLYYAVTTENTAPTDENLYTTSIPTATEAGTYYVWYKVVGDANHNDVDAECIEVTIEEEPAKEEPKEEPKPEEPAREEPKPEEPAKEEPTTEEPVVLKPEDLDEGELVADNDGLHFYIQDNGDVTCYTANDKEVYRGFACDGTDTYFFQWDGTAMRDRLTYHPDGEHVIYFDENGHEVFNDFAHVKHSIAGEEVDDYCFFNVYGYMYVDVITYDKTGTVLYYINPYGVMEIDKWFQFSDTVKWGDDMPTEGIAEGYGYANADGTLMKDQITYDWEGRQCYMQGNGVALY